MELKQKSYNFEKCVLLAKWKNFDKYFSFIWNGEKEGGAYFTIQTDLANMHLVKELNLAEQTKSFIQESNEI